MFVFNRLTLHPPSSKYAASSYEGNISPISDGDDNVSAPQPSAMPSQSKQRLDPKQQSRQTMPDDRGARPGDRGVDHANRSVSSMDTKMRSSSVKASSQTTIAPTRTSPCHTHPISPLVENIESPQSIEDVQQASPAPPAPPTTTSLLTDWTPPRLLELLRAPAELAGDLLPPSMLLPSLGLPAPAPQSSGTNKSADYTAVLATLVQDPHSVLAQALEVYELPASQAAPSRYGEVIICD